MVQLRSLRPLGLLVLCESSQFLLGSRAGDEGKSGRPDSGFDGDAIARGGDVPYGRTGLVRDPRAWHDTGDSVEQHGLVRDHRAWHRSGDSVEHVGGRDGRVKDPGAWHHSGDAVEQILDPADCHESLQSWQQDWSVAKKEFCCERRNLGCAPEEFDCKESLGDWQNSWSAAKKDWCCKHRDVGCKPDPYDCLGPTRTPFDWSSDKRRWCCQEMRLGCDESSDSDVRSDEPWETRRAWNGMSGESSVEDHADDYDDYVSPDPAEADLPAQRRYDHDSGFVPAGLREDGGAETSEAQPVD